MRFIGHFPPQSAKLLLTYYSLLFILSYKCDGTVSPASPKMETERNCGSRQGHRIGIERHTTPGHSRSSGGKSQAGREDAVAFLLRLQQSGARMEEEHLGQGHRGCRAGSAPIPVHLGLGRATGEMAPVISPHVTHVPTCSGSKVLWPALQKQKHSSIHVSSPEDGDSTVGGRQSKGLQPPKS